MMMTSDLNNDATDGKEEEPVYSGPSKSQVKRDCEHLVDLGEEILKLKPDEIKTLDLPDELKEAVTTALKIKSRSGLKRQRLYIGKLLRSLDNETIKAQVTKIQHQNDTNTAHFKRLERWRDNLIANDKETLNEIFNRFRYIDRQHINQLIRSAHQEAKQEKPPSASRKLFKYLRELESENADDEV
jgi:ribosome-associated protein